MLGFITDRLAWLHNNRARLTQPPQEGIQVWGELLGLRIDLRDGGPSLNQGPEGITVVAPDAAAAEATILRWRKELLAGTIPQLIASWAPKLGVNPGRLTFRRMSTRWGTCNHRTGRLTFNTELSTKPTAQVEYVVVHELAHLKVPDHGPRFQAIMSSQVPQWRTLRRALNGR